MPAFICLKNKRNLYYLIVKKSKNKYCETIAHTIGISAFSLLSCMKNGIKL